MREPEIGAYVDADGIGHALVVRETADGGWRVLDIDIAEDTAHVVEALMGEQDGRPQAEAIARDYLTTVERAPHGTGREPGEAISEQGGRDAHSHRRPRAGSRKQPARGIALSRPAG